MQFLILPSISMQNRSLMGGVEYAADWQSRSKNYEATLQALRKQQSIFAIWQVPGVHGM
jgi:hypothetical protein